MDLDIFLFPFFQKTLFVGFLIGIIAPLIGVFIVLRRLSMIGDALSHVSIAGVALGFIIEVYPLALGIAFALIASFAIEKLRKAYPSYAELSIAIIMSGGIAFASVLFTSGKGFNINVQDYLFGSIVALDTADIWIVLTVTLLVIAFVFISYKELFLVTLDEDAASVSGLPTRLFNILITTLTALVISVIIKIVGALLVSALITIPVACSLVIAKSFRHTMWMAVIFSEIAVMGGLMVAGIWNFAPGGTVVLLSIALLMLSFLFSRSKAS
ncbi:metal ABC transporter permease [Chengkuizengella axinellae]|uniref:Metal ABC transporter permease n=1 Tax=Chengkuizengella axinellae TaxID=3064388 RepID=A0ABT9J4R6_9BACL|nr:metal ABC transporter permease [Chengkuizengella sp. 2205SS18-9]MDP5276625.1 metal ABC transporter permease [Chengkuizengella sp. 2205SS18-9]